eukprot:TRINITY_DN1355_c0_g1_i6.p5 TRINITY_DN1355_c0_g1~~TRINITY_DN1355_c0_g1_i6.p5  ORF type:complete len:105 (-),score=3.95 TRINITY_DN1355_c0_g1_i6:598-873(-)
MFGMMASPNVLANDPSFWFFTLLVIISNSLIILLNRFEKLEFILETVFKKICRSGQTLGVYAQRSRGHTSPYRYCCGKHVWDDGFTQCACQ